MCKGDGDDGFLPFMPPFLAIGDGAGAEGGAGDEGNYLGISGFWQQRRPCW